MYEVLQFRSALFLLVGLGFVGFTVTTESPFMFVISVGLLILNAFLVKTRRFHPIPRWVANALTLTIAAYTAMTIYADPRPIFPIGNFLVALQVIKLFEQRANRDYAQLLVLSLLLMVAAAISTAGLAFGVVFIFYLLLSPYTCLLFHLKVEADHAKRLIGMAERDPDPMTLKQDQRFLNRSMTRVTAVIAVVSLGLAVIVFLFFPRMPGTNLLAFQFPRGPATTGMSEEMNMDSVKSVQQNTAEIAALRITHNGEPVSSGMFYLRGTIYDVYDGNANSPTAWSWSRASSVFPMFQPGPREANQERLLYATPSGQPVGDVQPGDDVWTQEFMPLKPIGVSFLPAMPGAVSISFDRRIQVGYSAADGIIQMAGRLDRPLGYKVTSTNVQPEVRRPWTVPNRAPQRVFIQPNPPDDDDGTPSLNPLGQAADPTPPYGRRGRGSRPLRSLIAPEVTTYAQRPDVSGVDDDGKPLIESLRTSTADVPSPAVEIVARNIERHLQSQFSYTLDLGDASRSRNDPADAGDPAVRFLYQTRSGWCEHFATAMTLMCQSLGMQARVVSGYKCDEFNTLGGYFIVRHSHAHAWVEVLVREGAVNVWRTFDPTGSRDAAGGPHEANAWTRFAHFFDYLEHLWANSVVAYDSTAQEGLLNKVEGELGNSSEHANNALRSTAQKISEWSEKLFGWRYTISAAVISTLLIIMGATALGLIAWYLIQRFRLTRRARRIGLGALDAPEARRLARQLGFYDDLVRILERRDIVRPGHLTPLEFGQSLSFLPRDAYDTILRLTKIFYRIRFGDTELTMGQRRTLSRVVDRLRDVLNPRPQG